jgi:hypothetical protein
MKSFKDIFTVKEVAQPNNPEEQKFKDQHKIQVFDHPVAEPSQFTGEIQGKGRALKRLSDYVAGEDENAYDQAYEESADAEDDDEESESLQEKAVSKSQQKLMAMALAFKRGEMEDDEASDEVKELAKSMSEKDLEDFAKTKHKGMPDKVAEAIDALVMENPQQEIPMMRQQLAFIVYAAREIDDYLMEVSDPEEWYQNKLAYAFAQMKSLHAYAEGEMSMMDRPSDEDQYNASYGGYYESIQEAFKQGKMKLKDGKTVNLSKDDAAALESMMKSVGAKNRKQMEADLMKNAKTFAEMLKFAKEAS